MIFKLFCYALMCVYLFSCNNSTKRRSNISDDSREQSNNGLVVMPRNNLRVLSDKSDSLRIIKQWTWEDYYGSIYSLEFTFNRIDVLACQHNRAQIRLSPMVKNCPDYFKLASFDKEFLKPIANKLKNIAIERNLDQERTAYMIINMIQNIPYTLVHPLQHTDMERIDLQNGTGFIKNYHDDNNNKPLDKNPFGGCCALVEPAGIYSPVEFLSGFKGDCDTRTVCIFTLLNLMNIPSIVVNGPGHSMLAVPFRPTNPSAPFIMHNTTKYFFLETTLFYNNYQYGTGPKPGDVTQNFNSSQWVPVLY